MRPGGQLKAIRARLKISMRDVESQSRKIAAIKGNDDYTISNARLTQIENKDSIPSIHKLYSLAAIMGISFADLIRLYDVDLDSLVGDQIAMGFGQTRRLMPESRDENRRISFPIRFDPTFSLNTTALLSRMVEMWGEIPVALVQHLNIRHHHYGVIGLKDFTMYPLLRPGSLVQIDPTVATVRAFTWRTEYDRPIYFIELRQGFACSWCEMLGGQLILVPHPLSRVECASSN